jgi:group I intron endonuclease
MYQIYRIVNRINGHFYIGMTKNSLSCRFASHRYAAKSGKKSKLYDAMRSYGIDNFIIEPLEKFDTKQECCEREIELIAKHDNLYNLASGGEGGFAVRNVEEWKAKLREARKGRQPALGMKHTEENKKFFSECSKRKVLKYKGELPKTYKEAKALLGISKTHYYRLVKRAGGSDPS